VQLLNAGGGYRNEPGAGRLFLEDVQGGPWSFDSPQHVWARQLNPENADRPKISNRGGTLWILGLKTERPTTVLRTTNGGSTELLGGFVYPVQAVSANTPAFVTIDSRVSLIYRTQMNRTSRYAIQLEETRKGHTRTLLAARSGRGALRWLYASLRPRVGPR